jgi:ribonuclease Z
MFSFWTVFSLMQSIRIVYLGTSSGTPSRERNVSSVAMLLDGTSLIFDCGEGTQHRLLAAPVRSGAIEAMFISHLHGDHVYGIPGLLATMGMNGRTAPLDLIGPEGLAEYVECTLRTSHHHPPFELRVEIASPSFVYRRRGFSVVSAPVDHSIPCVAYCVIEEDRPGEFDPERARALGIPEGPQWGELQRASDPRVCAPPRKGRRIVFCTDTRPCDSAIELARGADVLSHESTYGDELQQEAAERFHSTARDAARVAKAAGVGQLILTHFSTRYVDVRPLVEEAREVFENTIAAEDLAVFEV